MSTVDVPTLDIQVYRGITFRLNFEFKALDENGVVTGPFDLTGSELVLFVRDILSDDFTHSSNDPADSNGSYIQIDNEVGGLASMKLSAATLDAVRKSNGDWRIERWVAPDKDIMVHGVVQVLSYGNTGEI